MRYEFHPEALAEYEEAARYYAGCQRAWNFASSQRLNTPFSGFSKLRNAGVFWKMIFGGVSRAFFLMQCSTPSKRTLYSLLRSCTVTVNPATGVIVFRGEPNNSMPPTRYTRG